MNLSPFPPCAPTQHRRVTRCAVSKLGISITKTASAALLTSVVRAHAPRIRRTRDRVPATSPLTEISIRACDGEAVRAMTSGTMRTGEPVHNYL